MVHFIMNGCSLNSIIRDISALACERKEDRLALKQQRRGRQAGSRSSPRRGGDATDRSIDQAGRRLWRIAASHTTSMRSTSMAPTSWPSYPSRKCTTPPAWHACTTPRPRVYCAAQGMKRTNPSVSSQHSTRGGSWSAVAALPRPVLLTSQTPRPWTSSGRRMAASSP